MIHQLLRLPLLALLLGLWAAGLAAASESPRDVRNAATWYQRAIEQLERLPEQHLSAILMHDWDGSPPPAELRAALAAAQPIITAYQRGAQQEFSDFGIAGEFGPGTPLTHLNHMRRIGLIISADAMTRLHDGDAATAARRLADLYRASAHVGDDAVAISSLVGQGIFNIADSAVQAGIDRGAFGPEEAALLLRETQRLAETSDPFNFIGATFAEQEMLVQWFDEGLDEGDPAERYLEMMAGGPALDDNGLALIEELRVMTRDEFGEAVALFDVAIDHVVEIMSMEDHDAARAAMADFVSHVKAGEFGTLGRLCASLDHLLTQKQRGDVAIERRMQVLREIAQGQVQPEDLANAAVWYVRAVQSLDDVEIDFMELLRQFSAGAEVDVDEHPVSRQLEPMLLIVQPIIDDLRKGSLIRRCDFSIAGASPGSLTTSYSAGMRDAFRLIHADALRLSRSGRKNEAADRLAIGYRMIAHLSADPQLVSSITAHRALLEAQAVLEPLLDGNFFEDDQMEAIRSAFERIDGADAFGYLRGRRVTLAAITGIAEQADRRLGDGSRPAPEDDEDEDASEVDDFLDRATGRMLTNVEVVRRADDDGLLTFAAHWHFGQLLTVDDEEMTEGAEEMIRAKWSSLADVFDRDALIEARLDALRWMERFRDQQRYVFHGFPARAINQLAERRHLARADIRFTAALLREHTTGDIDAEALD